MRRVLTAGVMVVALLAAAPNASAAGCAVAEPFEVCFNDPNGDEAAKGVLVDRLRQTIAAAGRGDRIRVAMYSWTLTGIAAELARAKRRRADVRVVVDGASANGRPVRRMRKAKIPVTVCRGSCTGGGGINHLKLFLFNVGGARDVVVSSSNMTNKQRTQLFNDLIRVRNDARLYAYYYAYWRRLRSQDWRGWGPAQRVGPGDLGTQAYLFQRAPSDDPVVQILNGVTECRRDDRKIWVAMALFTRPEVQRTLQRLRNDLNCNVRVIIGRKVNRKFVGTGLKKSNIRRRPVHHKLLLIDARYEGQWRQTVFTGSHNFTRPALSTHDETWLRVDNPFVFETYRQHYLAVF